MRACGLVLLGLVALRAHAAPLTETSATLRAGLRLQAVATLSGGGAVPIPCLTPTLSALRQDPASASIAGRRALTTLLPDSPLAAERRFVDGEITVRYAGDRGSPDRLDSADENANGRPDLAETAVAGVARAQALLVGQLELPSPGPVEISFVRLGSGIEGVALPGRGGRVAILLEASLRSGAAVRRAAEHQFAHAVAMNAGLPASWAEAFATWSTFSLEGGPDARETAAIGRRVASLGEGLVSDDLDRASGNAAWFAFLHESYGSTAVKLAVEELSRGGPAESTLDRALRRAGGTGFDAAFREFQTWALLSGPRDDGRHFSFGARLAGPSFAASTDALPALSIQADPWVAPLGGALVLVRPDEAAGGLSLRFEGDPAARWSVDALLVRADGSMHRVPLSLDADDAGEAIVPLQGLDEAILLVRNLDGEGKPPRHYSWSAHVERGYPVEIVNLGVERDRASGGAIIGWETSIERGLLGFNVLRTARAGGTPTRVNPVWIPAVGASGSPAAYSFLDVTADASVAYEYVVEAVTTDGLATRSDPVPAPAR